MKLNKIDEVWKSANSLFEWRFRFVTTMATWRNDFSSLCTLFLDQKLLQFWQHTSCITYVCNTCLVLSLNSVLPSVLPPRRHGLLSETRNEGLSRLPFLLTQVLVRNCSTRYEFLTNGSRWESRTAVPGIFCPPVSIPCACMHAFCARALWFSYKCPSQKKIPPRRSNYRFNRLPTLPSSPTHFMN